MQEFREIKIINTADVLLDLHSVEKCYKTRSRFLRINQHFFREINVFTKEVTKQLISRKEFCVIAFCSTFPHCDLFKINLINFPKFNLTKI